MFFNRKKTISTIILILVFSFALFSIPEIRIVKADNEIYIRADGTVYGTDKIQRDGDVYTFTGDIGADDWSYGIIVERDNIVIDGAGYLLKGHGQLSMIEIFALGKPIIHGINLEGRNNVTVKNLQIWGFNSGFWGYNCTDIKILDNNLTKIATNIILQHCSHIIISGNTMINNGTDGIYFYQGHNNTITKNYIKDNGNGIHAYQFSNSTISGNKITKNTNGIYLDDSSTYNLISGNTLVNNTHGIGINASFNNTITGNNITNNNKHGIWLAGPSSNNTVTENNITNNENGMYFKQSSNNIIHNNNFIDNTIQVYDFGLEHPGSCPLSENIWDDGIEGNYWCDYVGADADGDGIGDSPHVLYENNQDNYPLMEPCIIQEFPSCFILPLLITATLLIIICKQRLPKNTKTNRNHSY